MMAIPEAGMYIWAHSQWKQRLRSAIETGKSEFSPEVVCTDNSCELGKWLHGLAPRQKTSPQWKKLQALHAEFHLETARVLKLALAGERNDAEKGIVLGSDFSRLSASLADLLTLVNR